MGLFNLTRDIGIDLGTANTLVTVKGKGIIIREPSVVAINKDTKEVIAVGEEAKKMIGKTPSNIIAIRPLKDGVIADFAITQNMLKHFIKKATKNLKLIKPRLLICIPSGITEVEKKAVIEAAEMAGAKNPNLIEEAMSAAIGAGLPVGEPTGNMVVDIGGGTTEIAILSLGGVVLSKSIPIGGDDFDQAIIHNIRNRHKLIIGERTAEKIKKNIASAYHEFEDKSMDVKGRDLISGLPKAINISTLEIHETLLETINSIVDSIKNILEKAPPELASDIIEKGIMLTGGGSLLVGLDLLIEEQTGIKAIVAEEPLDCVVKGTERVLENDGYYKVFLKNIKKIG